MITAIQNSLGHIHLFLGKLDLASDLDISNLKNIKRIGLFGTYESECYLQFESDIEGFKSYLVKGERRDLQEGWPVYLEDPGYLDSPLWRVIDDILDVKDSSLEKRIMDYINDVPVISDIRKIKPKNLQEFIKPFVKAKNHIEAKFARREYIEAAKEGLALPDADVFLWVTPDGEIDYGLVQDSFWVTLWVPNPENTDLKKLFDLAQRKLERLKEEYEIANRYAKNPFLAREERNAWKYSANALRHPAF